MKKHIEIWFRQLVISAVIVLATITGCTSRNPSEGPIIPTKTEVISAPTSENTNTPIPSVTKTPTKVSTPTKEIPKFPDRWNDPEVLARVQKRYDDNKPFFDSILRKEKVLDYGNQGCGLRGKIDAYKGIRGYGMGDISQDNYYYGPIPVGIVGFTYGRPGFLVDHQKIQFTPELIVDVAYIALLDEGDDSGPSFIIVPFIFAVENNQTKQSSSELNISCFDSDEAEYILKTAALDDIDDYLDKILLEGPPKVSVGFPIIQNNQGKVATDVLIYYYKNLYDLSIYSTMYPNNIYLTYEMLVKDYYTDENYPVGSGNWADPSFLIQGASKTRLGILSNSFDISLGNSHIINKEK
jgi:hypothetical protein